MAVASKPKPNGASKDIEIRHVRPSLLKPAGLVDTFAGSGTTLIACEQTGRTAYLMEIGPRYCDVIRKRYAALVGDTSEMAA